MAPVCRDSQFFVVEDRIPIVEWQIRYQDHAAPLVAIRKLYLLSTYMGHVKPEDTYWYLSATPELLEIATRKFEGLYGGDGV